MIFFFNFIFSMGNKPLPTLKTDFTASQLDSAIQKMMDKTENQRLTFNNIHQALEYIYVNVQFQALYHWSMEGEKFFVNPVIAKIFYSSQYQSVLSEMLSLFIEEQNFALKKISYFVKEEDWMFLNLLVSFLVIFMSSKIKNFSQSLQTMEEIQGQIRTLIVESGKDQNYRIPNILTVYENKAGFFMSLQKNINSLIEIMNGVLGKQAKKVPSIPQLISTSFILYLHIFFDSDDSIEEIVQKNIVANLQMATFILIFSFHYKQQILTQCCIIFLQSLIQYMNFDLPPLKVYGMRELPVNKVTTIYQQILLVIVYHLSLNQVRNPYRALQFLKDLVGKVKLVGDSNILYYLEQFCYRVNPQTVLRTFACEFIQEYVLVSRKTTKKLEKFRQLVDRLYKIKKDIGMKLVKPENVKEKMSQMVREKKEEFNKLHESYVFSHFCKKEILPPLDEKKFWGQI